MRQHQRLLASLGNLSEVGCRTLVAPGYAASASAGDLDVVLLFDVAAFAVGVQGGRVIGIAALIWVHVGHLAAPDPLISHLLLESLLL